MLAERTAGLGSSACSPQRNLLLEHLTPVIVHDFNNHLMAIVCCLHRMKAEVAKNNSSGVLRYIDAAHDATRRAKSLSNRLLEFSSGAASAETQTDVSAAIQGMEMLIRLAVSADVEVRFEIDDLAGSTLADPFQLENAVLNFCINAGAAMVGEGVLTISTGTESLDEVTATARNMAPGLFVTVSVSDTGTGITRENMEQMFAPFFSTKAAGEGTGLGLLSVRAFALQAGGALHVASALGHGTTMRLYLPRVQLTPISYEGVPDERADVNDISKGNAT